MTRPVHQVNRGRDGVQVLSDLTRAKLLFVLSQGELCVCDLVAIVHRSRPPVSHQLRLSRDLRLVKYRRDGKMAYYSLVDDHVRHLVEDRPAC